MKTSQYVRQDRAISAADSGGIRERWLYGLRLLRDPDAMSTGGGGLKHGIAATLSAAAQRAGLKLSEREIRYRIQCAKAYPTDSEIGKAIADFETWSGLIAAGFPAVAVSPGEFAAHDAKRAAYLADLIEAADGDLDMTWQAAHDRLPGDEQVSA